MTRPGKKKKKEDPEELLRKIAEDEDMPELVKILELGQIVAEKLYNHPEGFKILGTLTRSFMSAFSNLGVMPNVPGL